LLLAMAFCFVLLVAMTNAALSERIEQNKAAKLNDLIKVLLPGAEIFPPVTADIEVSLPDGSREHTHVFEVLSGDKQRLGWSFNAHGTGFAGPVELVLAVDANFQKMMGFEVLSSSETPGFGDQIKSDFYRRQFVNAPVERLALVKTGDPAVPDTQIVAITGATVSSQAVVNIVNTFLPQVRSQMQEKGLISNVRR